MKNPHFLNLLSFTQLRRLFLSMGLLLPQVLLAQRGTLFNSFKPGLYVLVNNPEVSVPGQLKLLRKSLEVKDEKGQIRTFQVAEVHYAKINGGRAYVAPGPFTTLANGGGMTVKNALVELLDSGRVLLMCHTYGQGGYMNSGEVAVYLLKNADGQALTTLPAGKKELTEALRSYVAERPDLLALLEKGIVDYSNLELFIHALNRAIPFAQPLRRPPPGLDY